MLQTLRTWLPWTLLVLVLAAWFGPRTLDWLQKFTPKQSVTDTANSTTYRTSSWFSNAYTFPTQPIFSFPLIARLQKPGIEIALPKEPHADTKLVASGFDAWCTLGFPQNLSFSTVKEWNDFSARIQLGPDSEDAELLLTQGSPTSLLTKAPRSLTITCNDGVSLKLENNTLIATRAGQPGSIILEAQDGISQVKTATPGLGTLQSEVGNYRIITVADNQATPIAELQQQPWTQAGEKQLEWRIQTGKDQVITTYKTPSGTPTWMVIWPHHFDSLTEPLEVVGTYPSAAGPLRVAYTAEYSTKQPVPDFTRNFPLQANNSHQTEIRAAITQEAEEALLTPVPAGVYFRGTWIGALSSLLQLSQIYDLPDTQQKLAAHLSEILEESSGDFIYDEDLKLVRALHPEFGNEKGNDHHFHYGYYLRGLSVLSDVQALSAGQEKLGQMLANDIATANLSSTEFPALRTFDRAFGHSWADATSNFADGNNQESTSEALQAWYGLWLWGDTTQDDAMKDLATWLFTQELDSTASYWYGINNPFPTGYTSPIASLVWHGKREFATWFSPQPEHVVGIQLLPITPVSKEIFKTIDSGKVMADLIATQPNLWRHEWGDLLLATWSYTNKEEAQEKISLVNGKAGLKLRSLLLHLIWANP